MLTKGAIGNLVNRYRAVLKKCNLINTFGSLAVASMLVMGGAGVASAAVLDSNQFGDEIFRTGGSFTVENAALELQDVTSTKATLYLVGGPSLVGNAQNSLTVGSAEKEAQGEYASSVSITNAEFSGTTFVVGAGLMEASGSSKPTPNSNYKADAEYFGTSVELTDVNAANSYIIGGGKIYNAGRGTIEVTNTNVTLAGNTVVGTVVGGSFVSGSNAKTTALITENTNVYIGKDVEVTGDVIGGHYHNWYGETASVGTTNVVLDGATMSGENAAIIGGNFIQVVERTDAAAMNVSSNVGKTNITVKNSVVGAIYAGDYVINDAKALASMETVAGETSLLVENSTVNGDVVGGSYITGKNEVSVVEPISVDIKMANTVVNGSITSDSIGVTGLSKSASKKSISLTNVSADSVTASSGTVNLRAEGEGKTTLQTLTVGSDTTVTMSTDGIANDIAGGDITKAIVIGDGEFDATVNMEEGMYEGAKSGKIENGVATVKEATNSIMANVLDMASSQALAMNRILMNDVRKRLGDIRADAGTHGVWMRYDGGSLSGSNGYENDFTTFQIGVDTQPTADAPRFGMAFAYTNSDADMKRGGAEMDAFSFAAYATKMYDNGLFFDVIGRLASTDTDVVVDGNKKGSMDNIALSVSGELGWRANIADKFYVEPQVELTYTRINSDRLTLNSGHEYEFDAVDSLVGRAGLAAGFKLPNNLGDVYARASVVSEFLGEATVRGGGRAHSIDGDDTWLEYGIGGNVKLTDKINVWADVERTEGATLDEEWRGTVGIRYSF